MSSKFKRVQNAGCLICGKKPNEVHHIHEVQYGGPDEEWNLMPLCTNHHDVWHASVGAFLQKWPKAWEWMLARGWMWENGEIWHD